MNIPQADFRPVGSEEHWSSDWARLMCEAQRGDQAAYHRLLEEILPVLRALLRKRIFDPVLLEDVIQDTLLAVHRVRHTFDPDHAFLPWLSALASARAVDALRARGRRVQREVTDPAAFEGFADPRTELETAAAAAAADVRRRLEFLPHRQRRAVELVKLQGMSVNDAARAANLSVPTLKSLLHRAMSHLRMHRDTDHE